MSKCVPAARTKSAAGKRRVVSVSSPSPTVTILPLKARACQDDHLRPQGVPPQPEALHIELPPSLSQELQSVFSRSFQHLQSFWGLYNVLVDDLRLQIPPPELSRALAALNDQRTDTTPAIPRTDCGTNSPAMPSSADTETHVISVEDFRFVVWRLLHNHHNVAPTVSATSGSPQEEWKPLIQVALLGSDEALPEDCDGSHPPSPCKDRSWQAKDDILQQVVRGAVVRLRQSVPSTSVHHQQLQGVQDAGHFSTSDVELVWDALFATHKRHVRSTTSSKEHGGRSAIDAFDNLPSELRALMASKEDAGDVDTDSLVSGDRHDSIIMRQNRGSSLTRVQSRTIVRKRYMHTLNFSGEKTLQDDNNDDFDSGSLSLTGTLTLGDELNNSGQNATQGPTSRSSGDTQHVSPTTEHHANAEEDQRHNADRPTTELDTVEMTVLECQRLLQRDVIISQTEEAAALRANDEARRRQAALLSRYRGSLNMFRERKQTTRLQLLGGGGPSTDGNNSSTLSRAMSAFDFGERCASYVDKQEEVNNDDAVSLDEDEEVASDEAGMNLLDLGVTHPREEEEGSLQHHEVIACAASTPSSTMFNGSLSASSHPAQWTTPPPSLSLGPHGGYDHAEKTVTRACQEDDNLQKKNRNEEMCRIRQHSALLTKAEKELLHSKRLSSAALKRECIALPQSVTQLLSGPAARTVHRIRSATPTAAASCKLRTASVVAVRAPRPHSSMSSSTGCFFGGASSPCQPATRVSTPHWLLSTSHASAAGAAHPPPLPTITCSPPPSEDSASRRGSSASGGMLPTVTPPRGFLQVPERPGTAPRKFTPRQGMTSSQETPRTGTPSSGCCPPSPIHSASASAHSSAVPSRVSTPTKELISLPWPSGPDNHVPRVAASIRGSGGPIAQRDKNWERWLQGGGR